jgi:hypothetical protein
VIDFLLKSEDAYSNELSLDLLIWEKNQATHVGSAYAENVVAEQIGRGKILG